MTRQQRQTRGIGQSRFRIEKATSSRLPFVAAVPCVVCGRTMAIQFGEPIATFRIGQELVGVCCDGCLTPASRDRLVRLREQSAHEVTR